MRMMLQLSIPVEAGNAAIAHGALASTLQKLMGELKPEAAYFFANEHGERSGIMVFEMTDSSQIPSIAEPLFLGFNAKINFQPVMNADDMAKGLGALQK